MKLNKISLIVALILTCLTAFVGCVFSTEKLSLSYDSTGFLADNFSLNPEGIKGIEIEWINGKIDISVGGEQIVVQETREQDLPQKLILRYKLINDVLFIKYMDSATVKREHINKDLSVIIPTNFDLSRLKIKSTTGDMCFDGLSLTQLELSVITGDIELKNINAKNISVNAITGDITLNNISATNDIDFHLITGDISATNVVTRSILSNAVTSDASFNNISCKKMDLKCVTGNFLISFDNSITGYAVKPDITSGNLTAENSIWEANERVWGDKSTLINLKITTGNAIINVNAYQ